MGETHKQGDSVVTKKRLVREVNCDKCHNFYYEYRFRVYTSPTHFFKGNFVLWFDTEDLAEFFDSDRFTRKQIAEYADEIGWNFLSSAPKGDVNRETMADFYADCRKTIDDYNEHNG